MARKRTLLDEASLRRRALARQLARLRRTLGLSQTMVARRMKTSQAALSRLERGLDDARTSTLDRFARALGKRIEYRVVNHSRPARLGGRR